MATCGCENSTPANDIGVNIMAQEPLFDLRFVWRDPETKKVMKGTFLFDHPQDAVPTYLNMIGNFPKLEIWLEDRNGNQVPMKIRVSDYYR